MVTMNILPFKLSLQRRQSPLPPGVVTALTQVDTVVTDLASRLNALTALHKETRQRLETIYRKVYRESPGKGDGQMDDEILRQTIKEPPREIRPGDTIGGF